MSLCLSSSKNICFFIIRHYHGNISPIYVNWQSSSANYFLSCFCFMFRGQNKKKENCYLGIERQVFVPSRKNAFTTWEVKGKEGMHATIIMNNQSKRRASFGGVAMHCLCSVFFTFTQGIHT